MNVTANDCHDWAANTGKRTQTPHGGSEVQTQGAKKLNELTLWQAKTSVLLDTILEYLDTMNKSRTTKH